MSFPGAPVALNLFQEAVRFLFVGSRSGPRGYFSALFLWVCSAALLHFFRGGGSAFIAYSSREGPSESHRFQGLPAAILSGLLSCLRSFPGERNVSISEEAVTQH